MIPALLYLQYHSIKNRIVRRIKRLKQPKYLLGAVVGGLLLGAIEAFSAGYLSSMYKDAVAFVVIIVVLFAMPQGLIGRAKIERV